MDTQVNGRWPAETTTVVYITHCPLSDEAMSGPRSTQDGDDGKRSNEQGAFSREFETSGRLEQYAPSFANQMRVASFWAAICLPVLYLPLLIVGLSSAVVTLVFTGLVCLHVLTLYVGHTYNQ